MNMVTDRHVSAKVYNICCGITIYHCTLLTRYIYAIDTHKKVMVIQIALSVNPASYYRFPTLQSVTTIFAHFVWIFDSTTLDYQSSWIYSTIWNLSDACIHHCLKAKYNTHMFRLTIVSGSRLNTYPFWSDQSYNMLSNTRIYIYDFIHAEFT